MSGTKKQYNAAEKTKIALEAIKGELIIAQISSKYGVHATQISKWKQQAIESMQAGFTSKRSSGINTDDEQSQLVDKLYRQIGKLSTECEWLKKNLKCLSSEQRESLIDENCSLSIRRQCQLLTLSRSNLYYKPTQINETELAVVNQVDEIYTEHP